MILVSAILILVTALILMRSKKEEKVKDFTKSDLQDLVNRNFFDSPRNGPADECWGTDEMIYY